MRYKFNNEYNIIVIESEDIGYFDYYLEKKGFGDLYFMFGIKDRIKVDYFGKDYIMQYIVNAKIDNFWEE